MDGSKTLPLPTEILQIWHLHRIEAILAVGVTCVLLRFAVQWRQRRHRNAVGPSSTRTVRSDGQELLVEKLKERDGIRSIEVGAPLDVKAFPAPTKFGPKRVNGLNRRKPALNNTKSAPVGEEIEPVIFYFTVGGSTKAYAERLSRSFKDTSARNHRILAPILHDLSEIDYDDYFLNCPHSSTASARTTFYILLIPSYDIDTELSRFLSHLQETHHDFRVNTAPLATLAGYSVFGFGEREGWPTEDQGFCSQAIEVDKWMAKLTGRKRAFPLGISDVKTDASKKLEEWQLGVNEVIDELSNGKGLGEGIPGSGEAVESDDEETSMVENDEEGAWPESTRKRVKTVKRATTTTETDLEDIKVPIPVDFTSNQPPSTLASQPKPMLTKTSPTYKSLTKQGYTIVGSHSGVKTCRWTKSALRGRGSCYKHSFYGIASHLCMEATPSLSCSNKCVFCWRHGTNPVGTTWRWTVDDPEDIFEGMKSGHYQKIKAMKGVPGVRAERFAEAMHIRHCALSLVGEPIFYPRINELLALLHHEHISTFLVCNAQHPEQLANLGPVTQLYVSIDASNKESLRRIDRPLHRDFWERFLKCMDILHSKRFTHRTVFRLTLVKGFNIEEEAEGYANLVERALPGFVEIKGVTYCGTSTAAGAGLSMQNVPFYEEVSAFVLALENILKRRGLEYGIAAEHAHSCCVLLADRTRFFKQREPELARGHGDSTPTWHTLIDYPKFFKCVESGDSFGPEDYVGAPTPDWALWGKGGFDPRDQRVDRKGRPKDVGA